MGEKYDNAITMIDRYIDNYDKLVESEPEIHMKLQWGCILLTLKSLKIDVERDEFSLNGL